MERRILEEQGQLTVEQNYANKEVTNSSFYFATLPSEVVADIIKRLRVHVLHKVFPLSQVFGDVITRSFTELDVNVFETRKCVPLEGDDFEEEGEIKGTKTIVRAWGRNFKPDYLMLLESCRYVRSLTLTLRLKNPSSVSLDNLFSACGDVLEELTLRHFYHGFNCPVIPSISTSIARHCSSLHTLGVWRQYTSASLSPLFIAFGEKVRHLKLLSSFKEKSLVVMARCCTHLEEVELDKAPSQFIRALKSSLQVVRFRSFSNQWTESPTVADLRTLVKKIPNVIIHLPRLHGYDDVEGVLNVCGKQLGALNCDVFTEPSRHFERLTSSMENIEEIGFTLNIEFPSRFLFTAFSTAKPKLRKLSIKGKTCNGILDYLSTKIWTLHELEYEVKEYAVIEDELIKFVSKNKRVERLSICYCSEVDTLDTKRQRTAALIRSMNRFPLIRYLNVCFDGWYRRHGKPSAIISDACVKFRGRGMSIKANGVQYL